MHSYCSGCLPRVPLPPPCLTRRLNELRHSLLVGKHRRDPVPTRVHVRVHLRVCVHFPVTHVASGDHGQGTITVPRTTTVEGTTVVSVDGTKVIRIIIKGVGSGGGGGGIGGKRLVVLLLSLLLSLLVWGGGHCNVHVEFVESVGVPWVGRQRCS